ncbi:hypothetical protein BCR44DRAFT_1445183 [Catenaria anguillulae PL171]|uniref:60S ribosomal subunit assembly/export protein loc1 n=1 Tax=Catenaria anguillulae PL171 TaxID=765915 RepID=A0A1Y2H6Z4_9FUNG|nr:hypothetical protein BCR44DRAFT_1445183 [Catenaria anguillulae PL171]
MTKPTSQAKPGPNRAKDALRRPQKPGLKRVKDAVPAAPRTSRKVAAATVTEPADGEDSTEPTEVPKHKQPKKTRTASHKKGGGTFATKDAQLALVASLVAQEEGTEKDKLERAEQRLAANEEREAKKKQKQSDKSTKLDLLKEQLKQKKKKAPAKPISKPEETIPSRKKKSVSFAASN